ncbi:MAG: 3-isopropylmalate dehydrogenase [Chloroflexi bacterium]|nr:3-isopropylmalate dehydrogenase [Chloroflexota bacterium]
MKARIAVLPGDGIGPEVVGHTTRLLSVIADKHGHDFTFVEGMIGGIAIDETGDPLPEETIKICEEADAILLGAVGGPKWSDPTATVQPERGLLGLRQHFGLFANLRPVKTYPALLEHAPLRAELLRDVDILFVRELVSGIYFGDRREQGSGEESHDTMRYTRAEVEQVANVAFRAAQGRRKKLCSVDKANVLASMRLWRRTVVDVSEDYADVELEHLLVDAATMHLLTRPGSFDVIVAGNMFGDILSDEASVLAGSLGMLPSASLRSDQFGLYEPVHGSAPDIAGQGKANPIGMFLSAALLLRYSLQLEAEASSIEAAIDAVLADGLRTADIVGQGGEAVSTEAFAEAVIAKL